MQDGAEDTWQNEAFFCALTIFYGAHEELRILKVISTFLYFLNKHLRKASQKKVVIWKKV